MDRKRETLVALRAAAGASVSGQVLADRLGVTRAAVAKYVSALRDLGYEIESFVGAGYRFVAAPDAPVPYEVAERVTSPLWVDFRGGGPTGSTNDDAKALARDGAPEGTVVLASEQSAGRGRLGRGWASPRGGAYFSAILRPDVAVGGLAPLALVAALGVTRGLEELGAAPSLKWPNDVSIGGAKLAGVLLETSAEADRVEWVVLGCGLNVRRPREDVLADAAYLEDVVPTATPARAAAAALDGVAVAYKAFAARGFPALRTEYLARHALADRDVLVRDHQGGLVARGRVSNVDEWGRLVIETAEGPAELAAGEVTLA